MATKNGKLKPKMLKEFLRDDSNTNYKSSNGLKSNPCGLPDDNSDPRVENLAEEVSTTTNNLCRSRSRSRAAANVAVSSFQKVLNAVKSFHYSSTPSTLQRSVSRRLRGKWNVKKRSNNSSSEVMSSKIVVVTVKVKDILRWRSFRDLVVDHQDESQPSDRVGPTDAPSTSNSWVDSDSTVNEEEEEEELPRWSGNSGDDEGDKREEVVASDSEMGPKEDYHKTASEEGTEQQSPVSVLGSPFRDEVSDEEFPSTFEQSLANMEKTKQRFLQSIQLFESLAGVHDEDDETAESIDEEEEHPSKEDDIVEPKSKACLSRGFCWFKRGAASLKDKKECIQGMEMQGKWSKYEEERSEVAVDMEVGLLNDLLDEVLFDLKG